MHFLVLELVNNQQSSSVASAQEVVCILSCCYSVNYERLSQNINDIVEYHITLSVVTCQ